MFTLLFCSVSLIISTHQGSIVEELGDSPQRRLSKTPEVELKDMSIRDAIVAAHESIKSQVQENPQLATIVQVGS